MHSYEIEIKSLLGSKDKADELKRDIAKADTSSRLVAKNRQLNHYFVGGDFKKLYESVEKLLPSNKVAELKRVIDKGMDFSVRTRQLDDRIFLVIKASVDDTTSSNGISRIEFEEEISGKTLDELDKILLDAGFSYQAKWSREREEYICKGTNVTIDKNAGYGYVAEFERMINDSSMADEAQKEIRSLMDELGVIELEQDRLERMFAHYNDNWRDYYGTDKIFVIE